MGGDMSSASDDEAAIRELVEHRARAVRAKDFNGILANHAGHLDVRRTAATGIERH